MLKFKRKVQCEGELFVVDWLSEQTELSKMKIKKTIGMGGLWITNQGRKRKRVKKIKTKVKAGDFVELNHNPDLDFSDQQPPEIVYEEKGFGVWFKPASMPSDTTPFSDQGCLTYYLKQQKSSVFLINRLDFEVSGLVLIAYQKEMARKLSWLIKEHKITKLYLGEVAGVLEKPQAIDLSLDGKSALTEVSPLTCTDSSTKILINIKTGRYHQIRRHLSMIHYPLLGDPRYGKNNQDPRGLMLQAYKLEFVSPNTKEIVSIEVPQKLFEV